MAGTEASDPRRRVWRWAALCVLAVLVASNFTPLPILLGLEPFLPVYTFENGDGTFTTTECPSKGDPPGWPATMLAAHLRRNGGADDRLHRTMPIELWRVWKWRSYLVDDRWRLPYKPPSQSGR